MDRRVTEHERSPLRRRINPRRLGIVLLAVALLGGMWAARPLPLLADEPHHFGQIRLFLNSQFFVIPTLTTIPGYHAIVSLIARAAGTDNLADLRTCSFILSLASLGIVFALAQRSHDGRGVERLLQIAFLPILFPLFFLLYTDVVAILFLALALLLQDKLKSVGATLAGLAALAVRQTYVVWLLFAASLAAATTRKAGAAKPLLIGYGISVVAFVAFVLWNGGIALGDRGMHPFPGLYLGNVYFGLFTSFLLLLPLHLANASEIPKLLSRPATVGALAALLVVFLFTFSNEHPYNQPDLNWFLHNRMLTFLGSSLWTKLAMFACMAIALLSLAVTPLRTRAHYLLYPYSVASLLPVWMIEPRYYLTPLVLFLLFRKQRSLRFEWLLITYGLVLSVVLFAGIARQAFFL